MWMVLILLVALRKESVDRNTIISYTIDNERKVALRKESVDRNGKHSQGPLHRGVALRKESVDRNTENAVLFLLTAVALRKESVDRNPHLQEAVRRKNRRSPQGERG